MKIKWKEIYSVDEPSIDSDHKKLFQILEDISNCGYEDREEKMLEMFDQLAEYSRFHFSREENYMKSIRFPNLEVHKLEHMFFIEEVLKLKEKSKNFVLLNNTLDFLKEWIITHILGSDKEYQKHKTESNI